MSQLWRFEFEQDYLDQLGYPGSIKWQVGIDIPPVAWVSIFLVIILLVNFLPVKQYGRLEYLFGCAKMIFIVGLIMFNVILNTLKLDQQRTSSNPFWAYKSFGSSNFTLSRIDQNNNPQILEGGVGRLAGMWSAMTTIGKNLLI